MSQQAALIDGPTVVQLGRARDNRSFLADNVSDGGEGGVAPSVHSSVMDQLQVHSQNSLYEYERTGQCLLLITMSISL